MIFLWKFSYGDVLMIFPWCSYDFPMIFYGFPMVFLWFSDGFLMIFLGKSPGIGLLEGGDHHARAGAHLQGARRQGPCHVLKMGKQRK